MSEFGPPARRVASRLRTEFGQLLVPLVTRSPGAIASVLSDDQGDAIDFAHDRNEIAELEVQLIGAQIGQSILRLHQSARRHWLSDPAVLLETSDSSLIAAGISNAYVLALFLRRRANLAQALTVFSGTRTMIANLLR